MSTTIYHEDDGEAVVELSARRTPGGYYLIETIDGGESNTIYLPNDSHARLLALLAPEPEVARSPHPLALTCPCCQGDGWVRPDWTPEPSDAEIEAAAKALWESETHLMSWENLPENTHDRWNTIRQAKAALAAARAARQTGGAS